MPERRELDFEVIARMDIDEVTEMLQERMRSFCAEGMDPAAALLAAVGLSDGRRSSVETVVPHLVEAVKHSERPH